MWFAIGLVVFKTLCVPLRASLSRRLIQRLLRIRFRLMGPVLVSVWRVLMVVRFRWCGVALMVWTHSRCVRLPRMVSRRGGVLR